MIMKSHFKSGRHLTFVSILSLFLLGCPPTPFVPGDGGTTANDNTGIPDNDNGDVPDGDANLAVFQAPGSRFSTSDVHDFDGEIVRFNTAVRSIIWATDGSEFDAGFWEVNGNLLGPGGFFEVRFGSEGGQTRAYFTETLTATLCDVFIDAGELAVTSTNVPVPQE